MNHVRHKFGDVCRQENVAMWAGFFYAKLRRRLHYDEWHLKELDYLRIRIGGGDGSPKFNKDNCSKELI